MKSYDPSIILAAPSPNVFFDYGFTHKNAKVLAIRGGADTRLLNTDIFYSLDTEISDHDLVQIRYNQASVKFHPKWEALLEKSQRRVLFQKQSKLTEELQKKYQLVILNNPRETQEYLEDKTNFRELLKEYDCIPQTEILLKGELLVKKYHELPFKKSVIQGDNTSGGRGTHFVLEEEDFIDSIARIQTEEYQRYIITEYIEGQTMGVIGVNYGEGTVVSIPYEQIIGDERLYLTPFEPHKIKGKFSGNSIPSNHYLYQKIINTVQEIGELFRKNFSYKGIFGLDLIITENNEVKVIECNPRITGAFPVIDMYYSAYGIKPPLQLHIEAFCQVNISGWEEIQNQYIAREGWGLSQAIFMIDKSNVHDRLFPTSNLQPGKYEIRKGVITFKEATLQLDQSDNQCFVVCEVPQEGTKMGKRERVARLIMSWEYEKEKKLTQEVIDWVKTNLRLPDETTSSRDQ